MPHREWVGTRLNLFVQAWNTQAVRREALPQRYEDLADARWKGKLGIETEDSDWFATVVKDMGEERDLALFRRIVATNGISVRKGHSLLAGLVASGEVPFALTVYSHNAEKLKQRGAPIDWYASPPAIARAKGAAIARRPARRSRRRARRIREVGPALQRGHRRAGAVASGVSMRPRLRRDSAPLTPSSTALAQNTG